MKGGLSNVQIWKEEKLCLVSKYRDNFSITISVYVNYYWGINFKGVKINPFTLILLS